MTKYGFGKIPGTGAMSLKNYFQTILLPCLVSELIFRPHHSRISSLCRSVIAFLVRRPRMASFASSLRGYLPLPSHRPRRTSVSRAFIFLRSLSSTLEYVRSCIMSNLRRLIPHPACPETSTIECEMSRLKGQVQFVDSEIQLGYLHTFSIRQHLHYVSQPIFLVTSP